MLEGMMFGAGFVIGAGITLKLFTWGSDKFFNYLHTLERQRKLKKK